MLAHSSWQSWCNWVRFVGLLAHTCVFCSAEICYIGLRSGLGDRHSHTLTLLSLSHFATILEVCLGSLSIWRLICDQALTSWLMSWDVASIYTHHFSSWWSAPVPPAAKHPHNLILHPMLHGWDGVLRLASIPLFPPNITMVIMAKEFYFCFIRPEDENNDLCPHVQLQTIVWLFYGGFGTVASSLLSGLSGYVDIGLGLLWI